MPSVDLESLLVREGVAAAPEEIRSALEYGQRAHRNPVVALVERGIVVEDVLAEVLARASGTVVVDLESADIDRRLTRVLSAEVARSYLVLPVSQPAGGRLRVAFANPFDLDAQRAVEASSGAQAQVLVAPVSALRAAVERLYTTRPTQALGPGGDLPQENTRRLLTPLSEIPSTDTAPLHRLAARATAEQRHEALLLALIEKGVLTRAEYMTALERLLSGPRESAE